MTPQKRKRRHDATAPRRAAPGATAALATWPPIVVAAALLVYFALYLRAPFPDAASDIARGRFVAAELLLVDGWPADWLGDPPRAAPLDRLPVLGVAVALVVVATVAGDLLLGWLVPGGLTRLERFVFACGLGLNLVATWVLLVGLAGGLRRAWLLGPAALLLLAAGLRHVRARRRLMHDAQADRPSGRPPSATKADRDAACALLGESTGATRLAGWSATTWLLLAAPFAVVILLGGMLPPVEFDVREYHLQAPKEFFQQGRITYLPHNVYANMPLGAEMLALAGMVLTGDWWSGALVGKTLIACFALLGAVGLMAAGRRLFSPAAGVVAALLYLATPWIARASMLGQIEGVLACYILLALFALLLWQSWDKADNADHADGADGAEGAEPFSSADGPAPRPAARRWGPLALAGLLAGGAAGCKYPAVVFVVLPLAVLVALVARRRLRAVAVLLLAVAIGGGSWYAKNLALTGNPTYPLLYSVWGGTPSGGTSWTAEKDARWRRAHRPPNFAPRDAVARLIDLAGRSPWQSPLLFPLAVVAALALWRRRVVRLLLLYVVYFIAAWWLLTHRIDRFWVPLLPIVALLAGAGATWREDRRWNWVVRAGVLGALAIGFVLIAVPNYNRFLVGYDRLRRSEQRVDAWHLYLNDAVPAGGGVLAVGDAEVFDLEVPVDYSTVFDGCLLETWLAADGPRGLHAELDRRGITHVFVHWSEIARYRSPGNYGFSDAVRPALFTRLVREGVLARPAPMLEGHHGQVFRVEPLDAASGR